MEIILDGKHISQKSDLLDIFKQSFSELVGSNLDALWDILSSYQGDVTVRIYNYQALKDNLGSDLDKLNQLFETLKSTNENFCYEIID